MVEQANEADAARIRSAQTSDTHCSRGTPELSNQKAVSAQAQQSDLETGQFDMAAFGFGAPSGAGTPQRDALDRPESSPAWPAASAFDAGMLDMSAFGMGVSPMGGSASGHTSGYQPASVFESGQPDMSAFGLPGFETAVVQEPRKPEAAAGLDSGLIDMAAFGVPLANYSTEVVESKPAGKGGFEAGEIDMSALGLPAYGDSVQDTGMETQGAASGFESGLLDMSAFGLSFAPDVAPISSYSGSTSFETGKLQTSTFGLPAPEPIPSPPKQVAASSFESGQLDMSAFGITTHSDCDHVPAYQRSNSDSKATSTTPKTSSTSARAKNVSSSLQHPSVTPFSSAELMQLRELLGLSRDQSLLRLREGRGRPGAQGQQQNQQQQQQQLYQGLHTAASLFASASSGTSAEGESGKGVSAVESEVPVAAPGLTVAETATALRLAELLLPDTDSEGCVSCANL